MDMPKIYAKVYRTGGEILVAACDEDIIGLIFSEGEICLEIKREFYGGELMETDRLVSLLSEATIANLTGNHAVNTAIDNGFIGRNNVLEISNVKHAQMINI